MEEFASELLQQLPSAFFIGLSQAWEIKGIVAEEGLRLVFLPFHEFNLVSCLIALGWIVIFWKNKGLLLGGILHILHLSEILKEFLVKIALVSKRVL